MTFQQFDELVVSQVDVCKQLLLSKGSDYSSDKDRLSNFKAAAERLGMTPFQVLGVYLDKHMCAVNSFLSSGKVESEPIEGRISDVINYMFLLLGLIEDSKQDC